MTGSKKMGLALLSAGLLLSAGCTTSIKKYPYNMMDPTLQLSALHRDQYQILGDVEGRASGTTILGLFHITDGGNKGFTGSLVGGLQGAMFSGLDSIEQAALYNAMESQPDADGIVAVRVVKEELASNFFWSTESVVVKGKAVKIKKG